VLAGLSNHHTRCLYGVTVIALVDDLHQSVNCLDGLRHEQARYLAGQSIALFPDSLPERRIRGEAASDGAATHADNCASGVLSDSAGQSGHEEPVLRV